MSLFQHREPSSRPEAVGKSPVASAGPPGFPRSPVHIWCRCSGTGRDQCSPCSVNLSVCLPGFGTSVGMEVYQEKRKEYGYTQFYSERFSAPSPDVKFTIVQKDS